MSVLAIVLIVIAVLAVIFFVGGLVYSRRRLDSPVWEEHVRQADSALERARASDRGWDRDVLQRTAQDALAQQRPDWPYEDLHLVLVDDRPGMAEDAAHYVAVGPDGHIRVVLVRDADGSWSAESVS